MSARATDHGCRRRRLVALLHAFLPAVLLATLPALIAWAPVAEQSQPAGSGERPPSRLHLVRPAGPLVPGQQANLTIETLGEGGKPQAVQRPVVVALSGAAGLVATTQVTVAAGSASVEVPLQTAKPGLWQVDARAHGLYSASTVIVCVAPAVLKRHEAVAASAAAARPATRPATATLRPAVPATRVSGEAPPPPAPHAVPIAPTSAMPPPPPPAPAAQEQTTAAAGAPRPRLQARRLHAAVPLPKAEPRPAPRGAPAAAGERVAAQQAAVLVATAAPSPPAAGSLGGAGSSGGGVGSSGAGAPAGAGAAGEVRLIPEHLQRYRGTQGWDSVSIDAYWYENGNPGPAPHDLDLALVSGQGNLQIDPVRLSIPNGDFVSSHAAVVTASAAQSTSLQALYPGGQSNMVDISFLAAPPAKLSFSSGPQQIRAFGVASSDVYVRLLDAAGEPAVADRPVQVNLQLTGPIGSPQLAPASIDAGQIEARVPLSLPRFGAYTVIASAAGLADASPLAIEVAFDWMLLLAALLGGLLGSLTRVLYRGDGADENPRRLLRVLLLGGLAALLVVLLSAFGLLSLLAGALPQGFTDALAKVPLGSLTGVFLLGFLAGLLFDRVFGRLLSPATGSAGAPPPAAPTVPAKP